MNPAVVQDFDRPLVTDERPVPVPGHAHPTTPAGRPGLHVLAAGLAEWLAVGSDVTGDDRRRAEEALRAIGVTEILDALDMAERVLRSGNNFHSVARFFADGSAEQDYVLSVVDVDAPDGR